MNENDKEKLIIRLSNVFARFHYKITFIINNNSSFLLSTDLLRDNIKRQLFKIVAVNVESFFLELLISEDKTPNLVHEPTIFFYLIEKTIQDFFEGYYGLNVYINSKIIKDSFYTKLLINEKKILLDIPLDVLKNESPKLFQSIFFPIYSKPYDSFIEALFDNLIVEITNAVMFIIVNEFSSLYKIRKRIYRSNFLSLRNIERFRNNLNWQSRIRNSIKRPADIYDGKQGIWVIRTTGIYYRVIYANLSEELTNLKQISLITLISIETKDFIISRIDETIYLFGNSIRYILTSVIGQVIGLIWRGIIEGLKK